jgi:hypothetical protein
MNTSNIVFSKMDQIFKDPMTIDRVVHHAFLLEFTGRSVEPRLQNNSARQASSCSTRINIIRSTKESPDADGGSMTRPKTGSNESSRRQN